MCSGQSAAQLPPAASAPPPPSPAWKTACRADLVELLHRSPDCGLAFTSTQPGRAPQASVHVPVHTQILQMQSQTLRDLVQLVEPGGSLPPMELSDMSGWLEALHFVYPLRPPEALNWRKLAEMLPTLHKFDMRRLLVECCNWVEDVHQTMSPRSEDDNYVLRWLEVGERLQLDSIKAKALTSFRQLLERGEVAMLEDAEGLAQFTPASLITLLGLAGHSNTDYLPSPQTTTYFQSCPCTAYTTTTLGLYNRGYAVTVQDAHVRLHCGACGAQMPLR